MHFKNTELDFLTPQNTLKMSKRGKVAHESSNLVFFYLNCHGTMALLTGLTMRKAFIAFTARVGIPGVVWQRNL